MIGGQDHRDVVQPDALVEKLEEAFEFDVESEDDVLHLLGVGAEDVSACVGGGEGDREEVGTTWGTELFAIHGGFGEFAEEGVAERGWNDGLEAFGR